MASQTMSANNQAELWSGGKEPMNASYGKLMMWYFLLSDTFTFASFLVAYGALRFSHADWPDPTHVFDAFPGLGDMHAPLMFVSLMTFILIMSSVTMVRAVQEGNQMNRKGVVYWLILTIIGGAAFLGCQAWEWTHLIHGGTTFSGNPYGAPVFGQLFFVITGFHGSHVASGVVLNIITLVRAWKGHYDRLGHYEFVEKVGLYWHFVDLVWVFVFLCFYLL